MLKEGKTTGGNITATARRVKTGLNSYSRISKDKYPARHRSRINNLTNRLADRVAKKTSTRGKDKENMINWAKTDAMKELVDWQLKLGTLILEGKTTGQDPVATGRRVAKYVRRGENALGFTATNDDNKVRSIGDAIFHKTFKSSDFKNAPKAAHKAKTNYFKAYHKRKRDFEKSDRADEKRYDAMSKNKWPKKRTVSVDKVPIISKIYRKSNKVNESNKKAGRLIRLLKAQRKQPDNQELRSKIDSAYPKFMAKRKKNVERYIDSDTEKK
jgi:hypothetical protein